MEMLMHTFKAYIGVVCCSLLIVIIALTVIALRCMPHQLVQWSPTLCRYSVYYTWYGKDLYPGLGMILTQPPKNYSGIWIDRYHNGAIGNIYVYRNGEQIDAIYQVYANEDELVY